ISPEANNSQPRSTIALGAGNTIAGSQPIRETASHTAISAAKIIACWKRSERHIRLKLRRVGPAREGEADRVALRGESRAAHRREIARLRQVDFGQTCDPAGPLGQHQDAVAEK